jgi:hypothetical protein
MFKVEVGRQGLGNCLKCHQYSIRKPAQALENVVEQEPVTCTEQFQRRSTERVFYARIIQCAFTEVSCPLVHPCLFADFRALERSMHETKHNCIIILNSEAVVSNVLSQNVLRNKPE